MRRLNIHVHVTDEHGATHVFGPGDDVPSWAVKRITNPHVWADSGQKQQAAASPDPDGSSGTEVPPMSGKGSGKEAWADYAAARDVDVPEGASRDDIVQALEEAGVPTGRE